MTSRTRSAPTASRSRPVTTRSRSTSPRRPRRSTSRPRSGDAIAIEERDPDEVTHFAGRPVAPEGSAARNPAFDVTPGAPRHRDRDRSGHRPPAVPPLPRRPRAAGGAKLSHRVVSFGGVRARRVDDLLAALLPSRCAGLRSARRAAVRRVRATLTARPTSRRHPLVEWWTACFAYEGVGARSRRPGEVSRRTRGTAAARGAPRRRGARRRPPRSTSSRGRPRARSEDRDAGIDHGAVLARAVARRPRAARAPDARARAPGAPQTGTRRREPPRRAATACGVRGARAHRLGRRRCRDDGRHTRRARRAPCARAGAHAVFAATIARTPAPGQARAQRLYTPAITR